MDADSGSTHVEWRAFGEEAFALAERTGRPVLLALVTRWSQECHEMDEQTYAEPRVAAHVNEGFVPVRVDADRHPRVRERYNMGGFPSTVFLTPDGEVIAGATLLGVDGFRGILDSVREAWDSRGTAAGSVPRALREGPPPGGSLDDRIEERMVERLLGAYDEEFGGWGSDVKFPLPRTVEFGLVRAREQALRTLEAVHTHLLDTYDGGFYRCARNRNWRGARREKLTDENAALVRAFTYAYRYTGEETYREAAETGVEYLTTTLWTGEAFGASQGGDEAYFRLGPAEREEADPPAVDRTVLADRNGLAVDALLRVAADTDDERATRYARRAREFVCEQLVDGGRVTHCLDPEGDTHRQSGLLLDQARLLVGLTTSWAVLGEPGPAEAVADWTVDRLQTDAGAFRDGPAGGAGLVGEPLYPLDTAVEAAAALLDLSLLSGEHRYREAARRAMAALAGASDRMGVEVAGYASVVARLREPRAIEVGTPAGSDLHRAALRVAGHESVVVPRADERPDGPASGEARLLVDGTERDSADSPADLEGLLTE